MKDQYKSSYAKKNAAKKKQQKSLTKNQKEEVKKLALGKIETKYCSDSSLNLNNTTTGNNIGLNVFYPMIPAVEQGTGQHQRSGNTVSDALVRCQLQFWLPASAVNTCLWRVKIFVLESKRIKSVVNMYDATGVATSATGPLLNAGNGTMVNWGASTVGVDNQQYEKMPVNTDDYIVLHTKTFDLTKNVGTQNGGLALNAALPGEPAAIVPQNPNLGKAVKKVDFKIKIKKLLYDNTSINTIGGSYPSNHNIFFYVVSWDPTFTITPSSANPLPLFSKRCDIFYKDG